MTLGPEFIFPCLKECKGTVVPALRYRARPALNGGMMGLSDLACRSLSRHRASVLSKSMSLRLRSCHSGVKEGKRNPREYTHPRHALFHSDSVTLRWQWRRHAQKLNPSRGRTAKQQRSHSPTLCWEGSNTYAQTQTHIYTNTLQRPVSKQQDFLLSEETFNRLKLVNFLSRSIITANQT